MEAHDTSVGKGTPERRSVQANLDVPSDTLLVAFGGIAGDIGMPPFEFEAFTNRFAVKRLLIRDLAQAWYQLGLADVCTDVPGIAEYLRGVIREQGVGRVVFIGNSMGGFAALLFGAMLGVDEVHAFSPQTVVSRLGRLFCRDFRWRHQVGQIYRARGIDSRYWDLRPHMSAYAGGRTVYHLHYCAPHRLDSLHAERLGSIPNVVLHGYVHGGHQLIKQLRDNGELELVLRSGLAQSGAQ